MGGSAAGRGDGRRRSNKGRGWRRPPGVERRCPAPPWPSMHCLPGLVPALSSLLGALALLQLSLYLRVPSRYGKHEERLCRPRGRLPARCAWFVQELPSFLVPALLLALRSPPRLEPLGCRLLCCLFCWHYFYRYPGERAGRGDAAGGYRRSLSACLLVCRVCVVPAAAAAAAPLPSPAGSRQEFACCCLSAGGQTDCPQAERTGENRMSLPREGRCDF